MRLYLNIIYFIEVSFIQLMAKRAYECYNWEIFKAALECAHESYKYILRQNVDMINGPLQMDEDEFIQRFYNEAIIQLHELGEKRFIKYYSISAIAFKLAKSK